MCRSVPAVVQVYKSEDKFVDSFSSTTWVPGIELKLLCLLESTLVPWASSPTLCQTFAFVPLTLNFATRNLVCVFCSCCVCCCCCFYSNRFTLLTPNNLLSSSLLVGIYHIFFGWFSFSFFGMAVTEGSPAQGSNSKWVSGTTVSASVNIFLKWSLTFQQDNSEVYLLFNLFF